MPKSKTTSLGDPRPPRIGIDLLGSHLCGRNLLDILLKASFKGPCLPLLTFFGREETFTNRLEADNTTFFTVTEAIEPDDPPLAVIRSKKNSSLLVGIDQLKRHALDAFITAGNSGSLLAAATLNLPLLPGIDRPGFITLMPTRGKPVAVLDVGANVDVTAEHLLQFAKMGIAYQKSRGVASPTVGLLNIGEERGKGTTKHRHAYRLLQSLNQQTPASHLVFVGNIEGSDAFKGVVDVLVTDGFTGNIFLKTAEGIAEFVLDQIQHLSAPSALPEIAPLVEKLRSHLHFAQFPGALLCGTEGIVIKCHGASTPDAFIRSIDGASHLIKKFFQKKIRAELGA